MEVKRRRFTVHDYHRMGEAGILHEDDRVELIEGEIVEMAAIGTRHFSCVNRLNRLLVMSVGDEAVVSVQNPVRLNEHTEPRPTWRSSALATTGNHSPYPMTCCS
jgi:hypothetical protein